MAKSQQALIFHHTVFCYKIHCQSLRRSQVRLKQQVSMPSGAAHAVQVSVLRQIRAMAHVTEINDIADAQHYHLAWAALHKKTRSATLFQTLQWLQLFWKHFGDDKRLRLLIVYSGGEVIGIVPLIVARERTRVGSIRVLTYPLDEWSSFFGPIGPNPTATLAAAMRHISETPRDWDLLDLRWIDRDGSDQGRTATAMSFAGLNCRQSAWKSTAHVDTSTSWDEYFASRTSKFRNNIRRAQKKMAKHGNIELDRFRPEGSAFGDDDPRWDLYDSCVEIATKSWQGSSTTGNTMSHERVQPFLREVHKAAVRLGMVDLNLLRIDGKPVAFGYNYVNEGRVVGLRVGVDPRFHNDSAGTVLYARMFQDSFQRGDELFDLGPGSLEMKRHWFTNVAKNHRCTHYPMGSPRVQLLRLKHWVADKWSVAS